MEKIGPPVAGSERGLVIGSFCPPHLGHIALLDFAGSQVDELIVSLCARDDEEIAGELRLYWMRQIIERLPHAFLLDYVYDENHELPWGKDGSSRDASLAWAQFYLIRFQDHLPVKVFSSEEYGDYLAEYMGISHVMFDKERVKYPVSSRWIRRDPAMYEEFLPPEAKAYYDDVSE